MTERNLLAGFKFFSDVQAEKLEEIARKGEILAFDADDVIFRYDEPAVHFYGVLEGKVGLSVVFKDKVLKTEIEYEESIQASMVEEEKSIVVDTVKPGQVFGWASIVGPGRRTVTAHCMQSTRVIALPAAELRAMFEEDNALGYVIMKRMSDIISKRLKKRTEKLIETWVEAFDVDTI
ncbi:MAG: cyclic nucleotide-binding domain-containing protein [Desulfobacterales bacterium]|nr:MAG: cyclic nucleotide-binding domain-containing protein [Desulfobacterales bacterium]